MRNYAYWKRGRDLRAHAALALVLLVGCATTSPPLPPPAPSAAQPPDPAPQAVPAPALEPARPVTAPAELRRREIAVVVDRSSSAHAAVAAEVVAGLSPRLYQVSEFTSDEAQPLGALRDRVVTIVAVGAEAVSAVRAQLPGKPVVFCQVPNHAEALDAGGATWGVQSAPPLSLQLKSWQAIDPSLRTIALIVSESGAELAAEARQAANELSTDLLVATSSSDRETLYVFRRLATAVDGLWLLPDNDALSPQVLRELLSYAAGRGIGVLTFNEALLSRGALLTATAVPADVAATVRHVVERVVTGRTEGLPVMTPLSAAAFTLNQSVATALGLPPVAEPSWVAREPD